MAVTLAEVRTWPATVDVSTAARALGVSRTTAYRWVREHAFPVPVLTVGHKHRVVTAGLLRLLSDEGAAA